ncbi:Adenylate kinase isoenzyme 5 [Caenorhabditis elegans]|uniref:Adenylate kinase isoenzyme 5 n=1 Tax=Caenorhabditis elegans TaxID=6239 RepID=G5EC85_CAEEL|nr:Adenylate kinase isoenzyme 5 [Caenorhabditis elegans]CAA92123.2 Adenylate kinase isoenzyme 5 [Caenorhabditis elegans]|eukprot:NP_509786.2 Uncharacterized protein CELE_F13E6.2 [Caenorhabditis elegans]
MSGPSEARIYLQDHRIPQLFEGLMTGLIYSRPADPLKFLEESIVKIRSTPGITLSWDMFIGPEAGTQGRQYPPGAPHLNRRTSQNQAARPSTNQQTATQPQITTNAIEDTQESNSAEPEISREPSRTNTVEHRTPEPRLSLDDSKEEEMVVHRIPSVTRAAEVARIPDVPIILFMGGPGGGKTRHAARVADSLADNGLVHICMPDIIRTALGKYKDKYPEWKEANEHYIRGELIPNQLALTLLKAEMGRHPDAMGFFLEGYPREARQVEDFERQVKSVNMALILDYDERTLREHMERRGLGMEIIDQKIKEFKQKTLPSAKYFDDQKLLHLIPGEKDDQVIYEKMKALVVKALETGVPVLAALPPMAADRHHIASPAAPESVIPSPIMAESELTNSVLDTNVANHETINHDLSTSAIREPRSVAQTPLHSSGSGAGGGGGDVESKPATPAVQTPDESRATSTARSRESARKEKLATPDSKNAADTRNKTSSNGSSEIVSAAELGEPVGLPNNAPVILVLGAPGSQKNDISRRIAQKYDGFTMLSMGDILRKKINNEKNDEMWDKVSKKMNNGDPIPTKMCRTVLYEELHSRGTSNWGYVIEGYPKSPDQLVDLEHSLQRTDLAILIDCTEQFCLEVINKRNRENKRSDDDSDAVRSRMEYFKKNTLPMLKTLDDKGKLRVVDGDADPDTVFKEVVQVIDRTLYVEDDGDGTSLGDSKKGTLNSSLNSST